MVATFTTDEAGHATLSTPLEDGTYSVKEVTPPKGYKLDENIYTFTINGADTSSPEMCMSWKWMISPRT